MPREVIDYNQYDPGSRSSSSSSSILPAPNPTDVAQFGNHQGRVAHEGIRPTGAQGLSSESHRTLQVGSGVSKVRSLMSRAKKNIKNMTRPKLRSKSKIHAGNFDPV